METRATKFCLHFKTFSRQQIIIDWETSEIIYRCNRQTERLLVEASIIKKLDAMNLNDEPYKKYSQVVCS